MNFRRLKIRWLAPLIFFQFYLAATVLLFFFGPWPWEVTSPWLLAGYLIAAQVCIGVGYLSAWSRIYYSCSKSKESSEFSRNIEFGIKFLKCGLFVTYALLVPTSLSRTGSILPNILAGIGDPGAVYNQNFERLEGGNAFVIVEYLRILMSPLLIGVYPLTVVYWSRLSVKLKALCVVAILFNLSLYLATGTNKGFADFVVTLPWLVFLSLSAGILKLRIHRGLFIVGLLALFLMFLHFFGMGQIQREGGVGELGVFNTGVERLFANQEHSVSQFLSPDLRVIFESLTRYLGQGYYALSMSFGIEHSSTFGFGNSIFLARNADAFLGTNFFTSGSIPGLLEAQTGWGMFTLWHSIYPWLASDFGFFGTLLVMVFLSYLFALSWGRSLIYLSPRSVILSYLFLILFFYIPGNNQIFQSGDTCVAFLFLLASVMFIRPPTVDRSADPQPMSESSRTKPSGCL
ncbi:MAG: hypothetical protein B7X71_08320 [Polynucleobacter sp. 39-46-10]|nr:MAG: hypothetical protein B7X71_08320 [Polynucleobacter sp. 39-46-10]